jgi:imidazolonepropionase-like amidohydrolase
MNRYARFAAFAALLLAFALAASLSAQQAKVYAIRNAKIYTLAGPPIENGTIVIRDGKIAAVGAAVAVPAGATVIDAKGQHVYPGFFDSFSQLGLTEIDSVSATLDTTELGDFNPQIVTATAVHPASEHIPVARADGITHAVSAPAPTGAAGGGGFGGGGAPQPIIRGQASAIHLNGWVIDEMLIRKSVGMVVTWPTLGPAGGGGGFGGGQQQRRAFTEVRQQYEQRVNSIVELLGQARHYAQAWEKGSKQKFDRDLKLDALVPVVKGELPVLVYAQRARDIRNAVEFCEKQKLKMILVGGAEAWKVKDLLKEKGIPVILGPTQALPLNQDDPYDKPFTRAGELHAAGVKIAFATFNSADSRTLPQEAGQAVGFGLPWEEAVKAITLYPAQMLGLDKQFGAIETGKVANLVITTGDPLDLHTEVKHVFINGQQADLMNRHLHLYETYKKR